VLKHLVRFTLTILVFALSAPAAGFPAAAGAAESASSAARGSAAAAAATLRQLETVGKQIDVSAVAGAISPGIAKSLRAKVEAAAKAVQSNDGVRAGRIVDAFLKEVDAQSGHGIATSAALLLIASASGQGPTTLLSVPVGSAAVISTQVGESPVVVALPAGTSVAWIRFGSGGGETLPRAPGTQRLTSIEISAFDSFGRSVRQLGANAEISIGFEAATSVNTSSARISTLSATGGVEQLVTRVTTGSDATTATASTTHLSPFAVDALTSVPPWRFAYVAPPTVTTITPSTGSVCGNSTVVLTGSGFSNVGAVSLDGIPVQSYTVNSDTQITAFTSVSDVAGNVAGSVNDVDLRTFLTATAQSPEFANSGFLPWDNTLFGHAGPSYPGTPTYSGVAQPVVPRISAVAPNQGPTIGAPSAPGQDFTNPAIRITGCGFTAATAVLFGATPSPSFTVQDDTVIFAVPPTPGSGTVDIRVVTPLGISSIVPIGRFTYVTPPVITAITPSTGSVCGSTTVVLTGSGFTNVGSVSVEGTAAQSFTVDSDTQITVLTSVADVSGSVDRVEVVKFLAASALAPEFANSGFFVGSFDMRARTGLNHPGTPAYASVVQPAVARVSGVAPNQGPTIGAPSAPGQDFTNRAIRITGCGFTGATGVLFGATPSPSFTVQDDAVIFAVPPTPGSGTVDIRVVTPLGTSATTLIDRFAYVAPPTVTTITPSTGSVCGNSTVVLTGSGFSNVGAVSLDGIPVQSYTVNSDTQITAFTSVSDVAGNVAGSVNDVDLRTFLTATAQSPEFANSGFLPWDNTLFGHAGPSYPGTPTYSGVAQPVVPRISAVAPNQGPTIGAPSAPGQDFTNPAIRITGCGFTAATAVLFGATPSPSFTVQDDTVIFAVPPTPGSGTVDIRVVTPLGISSIVP
jgi:hypothetical protein